MPAGMSLWASLSSCSGDFAGGGCRVRPGQFGLVWVSVLVLLPAEENNSSKFQGKLEILGLNGPCSFSTRVVNAAARSGARKASGACRGGNLRTQWETPEAKDAVKCRKESYRAMVLDRKKVARPLLVGGETLSQGEEFKYFGSCSQVRGSWSVRSIGVKP